jgi:membrane-bound serine protease (ClpP class)
MWLPVCLVLVGLIAVIVELFVPAAGLVGLLGLGSIIGGVVTAYRDYGVVMGSVMLVSALVLVPLLIILYFKIFPRTFIGRRLILHDTQERERGFASYTAARYEDLLGKEGTAVTVLRPSGSIMIEERKYSVVTGGDFVDAGSRVRVIKVEGSRIIVKGV